MAVVRKSTVPLLERIEAEDPGKKKGNPFFVSRDDCYNTATELHPMLLQLVVVGMTLLNLFHSFQLLKQLISLFSHCMLLYSNL